MADPGMDIGMIVFGLVFLSLLDYLIGTCCMYSAARIFRYKKKDWRTPSNVAVYSLMVGVVVAAPFVIAIYLSHSSIEAVLSKGPRLLLPIGLVFIVKTAAILHEMKKAYDEGIKKTVYGYVTFVYLIMVSWITVAAVVSLIVSIYSIVSVSTGGYGGAEEGSLTGWWDLLPEDRWSYNASAKKFSVLYMNDAGEPINILAAEAADAGSETDCSVSSPAQSLIVNTSGYFALNATCESAVTQPGELYGILVQIHYTKVNNPLAPLFENGFFSGNASA